MLASFYMFQGRSLKTTWIVVLSLFILSVLLFFKEDNTTVKNRFIASQSELRKNISQILTPHIKSNERPAIITSSDLSLGFNMNTSDIYEVKYTIDEDLQKQSDKLLKQYKPDYGAVVMMDAKTGRILAMSSYVRADLGSDNLNLQATFPAASIFKIITAATVVDRKGLEPQHKIAYNGGSYTLHKQNVLSEKINKWTHFISLKDAFARSINTAFGRITLEKLNPQDLEEYARRFMFNKEIPSDFEIEMSQATVPMEKNYELTKVASGYNRFNTMSPIHGAMIAGAIINNGEFVAPYIVEEIKQGDKILYAGETYSIGQAITAQSAKKVQAMMEQTVLSGTSRKTFRQIIKEKKFREIEMGGKTGHFSGLNPKGTNDWFVGYATDGDNKIAIAAITVNIKKWTVKSSMLAKLMIRQHFKTILEEKEISKKLDQQRQDNDRNLIADRRPNKS